MNFLIFNDKGENFDLNLAASSSGTGNVTSLLGSAADSAAS